MTALISHLLIFSRSNPDFVLHLKLLVDFSETKKMLIVKLRSARPEWTPDGQEPSHLEYLKSYLKLHLYFQSSKTAVVTYQYNAVKQKRFFSSIFYRLNIRTLKRLKTK